jgi:hypothetical protein
MGSNLKILCSIVNKTVLRITTRMTIFVTGSENSRYCDEVLRKVYLLVDEVSGAEFSLRRPRLALNKL